MAFIYLPGLSNIIVLIKTVIGKQSLCIPVNGK